MESSDFMIVGGGKNEDVSHQRYGERHWTLVTAAGSGQQTEGIISFLSSNFKKGKLIVAEAKDLGGLLQSVSIETFHHPSSDYAQLPDVSYFAHGFDGPVDVSLTEAWDPGFGDFVRKIYEHHPRDVVHNSSNPLGVGVCEVSTHDDCRVTAAGAYIPTIPPNLTITTEGTVTKVVFQHQQAICIEIPGKMGTYPSPATCVQARVASKISVLARQEVVLSTGAIDSPKLLLLSGVGSAKDLQHHNIPIVRDLRGIGQKFNDCLFLGLVTMLKPGSHHRTSYINSPDSLEEAQKQWTNN